MAQEMTQEEHVMQLADNVAEFDLDKFTQTPSGRRYGEPLSFKKGASAELVKKHEDRYDKGFIAHIINPVSKYLMQILAKEHKIPLEVRSFDTALEARPVDEKTFVGQHYWEQHPEVLYKSSKAIWVIPHPVVIPDEGKLVYDINGSIEKSVKIVKGKESVKTSEETIEGGIKIENKGDLFDVLREAKILREHKTKAQGGGIYFNDDNYPNIASVGSGRSGGGGWLLANADWPSSENDDGLLRPELVEIDSNPTHHSAKA